LTQVTGQTPTDGLEQFQGRKLAASAAVVFLLPILIAILGAYLFGTIWAEESFASLGRWQTGGAAAGLVAGVLLAKALQAVMARRSAVKGANRQ